MTIKSILFEKMNMGTIFCYNGDYFIKTNDGNDQNECIINCVNLKTGELEWMPEDANVSMVSNAVLALEERTQNNS